MKYFNSFWMAGYECSDQLNAFGNRVDLLDASGHLRHLEEDYKKLGALNISTVREGIRWSKVEQRPYEYNFSAVSDVIQTARRNGIQVIWDLCHFGFPDDLTPLHPMFARRFASLCRAFVQHYRALLPGEKLIVTPINEVSFISWLGGSVKGTSPYCIDYGWEVKYALMKAYIEGVAAMKEMDQNVLILSTEPLVNITGSDEEESKSKNEEQYQVLDMLTGRICPELGGREEFLDIVGINFYHNNQWTYPGRELICWKKKDLNEGWRSLVELTIECYERYDRPFIISETSHYGDERPLWIEYMSLECCEILERGLPLRGICLYPVIDRPDWDFPDRWHHSGVWDVFDLQTLNRELHHPSYESIIRAQKKIAEVNKTSILEIFNV